MNTSSGDCSRAGSSHSLHLNLESKHAGSLDVPSCAMEVDLAKAGMHLLVEKPISMRPAEEVERLAEVRAVRPVHYSSYQQKR
jgi:hypothetical protein